MVRHYRLTDALLLGVALVYAWVMQEYSPCLTQRRGGRRDRIRWLPTADSGLLRCLAGKEVNRQKGG